MRGHFRLTLEFKTHTHTHTLTHNTGQRSFKKEKYHFVAVMSGKMRIFALCRDGMRLCRVVMIIIIFYKVFLFVR